MKLRVLGKPASAGSKTILPTKAGTKLLRAVEDALTVAEVWHDDAQVTDTLVRRRYATDAEPVGALIEIEVAGWHQLTLPTS
jgi:hypothetical protein